MRFTLKFLTAMLLAVCFTACPQVTGDTATALPGWTLGVKVGTVNFAPNYFSGDLVKVQRSNRLLEETFKRLTGRSLRIPNPLRIQAGDSSSVGFNLFVQVTKNAVAPTSALELRLSGPEGAIQDIDVTPAVFEYETAQFWQDYPLLLAQGNGVYGVQASVGEGSLSTTKAVNLEALPRLASLTKLTLGASPKDLVATWEAVPEARAYLVLVEDTATGELVGAGRVKTNLLDVSNANFTENKLYTVSVLAFSYDAFAERTAPYPNASDPINLSLTRSTVIASQPSLVLTLPTRQTDMNNPGVASSVPYSFSGLVGTSVVSTGITLHNGHSGLLRYSIEIESGNHGITLNGANSGWMTSYTGGTSQRVLEFKRDCTPAESATSAMVTVRSNDPLQPEKKFKVLFECYKKVTYSRKWQTFPADSNTNSVALSNDGKTLYSAGQSGIRVWDVTAGKIFKSISFGLASPLQWILLSPDGKKLLTSNNKILDATTFETLLNTTGVSSSYGVRWAWSPDSRFIAGVDYREGSYNGGAIIDAVTGAVKYQLPGLNYTFDQVAWSPDGQWFAASKSGVNGASAGGYIQVWNATTGVLNRQLSAQFIRGLAWNQASTQVIAQTFVPATQSRRIVRWTIADGIERASLAIPVVNGGGSALDIDGDLLAWDESNNRVWFSDGSAFNLGNSSIVPDFNGSLARRGVGYNLTARKAFSIDDEGIKLFDVDQLLLSRTLSADATPITSMDWNSQGSKFIVTQYKMARIYNSDGTLESEITGGSQSNDWSSISWSPDGKRFAVSSSEAASFKASVWDIASKKLISSTDLGSSRGNSQELGWSADGSSVIATSPNQIIAFNATTGAIVWSELGAGRFVVNPARTLMAIATSVGFNYQVEIRSVTDGSVQKTLEFGSSIGTPLPIWNSSGSKLAVFSSVYLRQFDAQTWNELGTAPANLMTLRSANWLTDTQILLLDTLPMATGSYRWRAVGAFTGTEISFLDEVSCINGCTVAISDDAQSIALSREGSGLEVWQRNP